MAKPKSRSKTRKPTTREWGATGVTELPQFSITNETREQILKDFKRHNVVKVPDTFFDVLRGAIASYLASIVLKKESRPAAIRKNLKAALDAAFRLNNKLNALDGNSRLLLDEAGASIHALQSIHLQRILSALYRALASAKEYRTSGGALTDQGLDQLAVEVAGAIEEYSGKSATTTKYGLYHSILVTVLRAIPGYRSQKGTSQDLVIRALEARKEKRYEW